MGGSLHENTRDLIFFAIMSDNDCVRAELVGQKAFSPLYVLHCSNHVRVESVAGALACAWCASHQQQSSAAM